MGEFWGDPEFVPCGMKSPYLPHQHQASEVFYIERPHRKSMFILLYTETITFI